LESYKENVTLEDSDEKNMLFGDINELLDGVFGDFSHSIPPIDSS
jgi:hypothetical protein